MHINGARVFFALKLTINSNLGNFPYTLSFYRFVPVKIFLPVIYRKPVVR